MFKFDKEVIINAEFINKVWGVFSAVGVLGAVRLSIRGGDTSSCLERFWRVI